MTKTIFMSTLTTHTLGVARCQAITTALELFKLQSIRVLLRRLLFNVHLSCLSSIDVVTFFKLTKNPRQQVFRLTLVLHKWLLWFSLSNTRSTSLSTLSPKIYNAADDASAHALTKVAMIWRKWAHAFLYIRLFTVEKISTLISMCTVSSW